MADIILPSKLIPERITVRFEFMDELEWGEVPVSAVFSVLVISGVDSNPELLLFQSPVITGTIVSHRIQGGVTGVVYRIICAVTGSTGKVYQKTAKLATLVSAAGTPPFNATYYTTPPYPVEVLDTFKITGSMLEGVLQSMLVLYNGLPENVQITGAMLNGTLVATLISYEYQENVQVTGSMLNSTLVVVLILYDYTENVQITGTMLNSTLDTVLIAYNNPPENIKITGTMLLGELI